MITDKLKSVGLNIVVLAFFVVPILLLFWAASELDTLMRITVWVMLLDLVLLLPLSLVRRFRRYIGGALVGSAYLFGGVMWLYSAMITARIWGWIGIGLGVLLAGVGFVPIALLASLLTARWEPFFSIILLTVLTMGAGMGGAMIMHARTVYEDEVGLAVQRLG